MEAPIRHAAQSTRRRSRKTCQLVHRLDDDLALHVFSFLDAKRLSLVMQTARRFRKIAGEDLLWRALLRRDVGEPNLPAHDARTSWRARWRQWQRLESCDCNEQETKSSASPQARFLHRAAGEPGSQLYVFGGQGKEGEFNDLWVLDKERALRGASDEWRFLRPAGATPDARQSATLTSVGDQILMFGGRQGEVTFLNDTWLFDTVSCRWSCVLPSETGHGLPGSAMPAPEAYAGCPSPRWAHSAVRFGDRVLVFGGSAPGRCFNDVHWFNVAKGEWEEAPPPPPPGAADVPAKRSGHCACAVGETMYVFGGNTTKASFNDLWAHDVRTGIWRQIATDGVSPPGRVGHTITALGARLFILGGREYAVSAEPRRAPFARAAARVARATRPTLTPPPPSQSDQLLRRDDALHQPADAALVAGLAPLALALGLARGARAHRPLRDGARRQAPPLRRPPRRRPLPRRHHHRRAHRLRSARNEPRVSYLCLLRS